MVFYTEEYDESYQFHVNYFLPNINLEHYILMEIVYHQTATDYNEAKILVEEMYEYNIANFFNKNVYFYSDLCKYIFDDKGRIIPLNEYIFLKLRLYATKFLNLLNEAENAIYEEMKKIESGNYSIGVKELAKLLFHDYDVEFIKTGEGLIAKYYYGSKIPYCIFRFDKIKQQKNIITNHRLTNIIYEEIFEEEGKFTYNILFGHRRAHSEEAMKLSLEFRDVKIIKRNSMKLSAAIHSPELRERNDKI